jgi:hypothetical protein
MVTLCVLASMAYGALFGLIGVLRQKRVMVIAFVYAMLVEGLLGWIPAVINQGIVSFRLRSILFRWMDFRVEKSLQDARMIAEDPSGWGQVGWILVMSVVFLGVALWWVGRTAGESVSEG